MGEEHTVDQVEDPASTPPDSSPCTTLKPAKSNRIWAEVMAIILVVVAASCYLAFDIKDWTKSDRSSSQKLLGILFAVSGSSAVLIFFALVWGNLNAVLMRELLSEVNINLVLLLLVANMTIDVVNPDSAFSIAFSAMLFVTIFGSIVLNALEAVSRPFCLFATFFVLLCVLFNTATYFIAHHGCNCEGDKIWAATHQKITKIEVKRMIFVEMIILLTSAVYIGVRDKNQKYISFPLGVVLKRPNLKRLGSSHTSFSSWLFTANHLAEVVATLLGIIALVLYFVYHNLGASVLGLLAVLISVLFVLKGNFDVTVLKLVLRQLPVVVILVCCVINIIWDFVQYRGTTDRLVSIIFLMTICLNLSLDAVRIVSRMYRLSVCICSIIMCVNLFFNTIFLLKPCNQHSGDTLITLVQIKRIVSFVILFSHIRPWFLLFVRNNNQTLYFVTTKVQKQLVLEHRDSDGGVYLCYKDKHPRYSSTQITSPLASPQPPFLSPASVLSTTHAAET